jgi:hypothetical protein
MCPFTVESWNFANVRIRDDAIAIHIAEETVEPRAKNDSSVRLPFAQALEGKIHTTTKPRKLAEPTPVFLSKPSHQVSTLHPAARSFSLL